MSGSQNNWLSPDMVFKLVPWAFALVAFYVGFQDRLVKVESAIVQQDARTAMLGKAMDEHKGDAKDNFNSLGAKIDKLSDKIDKLRERSK